MYNADRKIITYHCHAVFPSNYFFPTAETVSVNGSSAIGNCSSVDAVGVRSRCDSSTSRVLFDGNIPTLTGLDGDMWASQLLTLEPTINIQTRREIILDFTETPGVQRVQLVVFNCPEWGIAVQTIRLHAAQSIDVTTSLVATFPVPTITSCDSLVRICISQFIVQPVIALEFIPPPGSTWTHLAEVTFHVSSGSICPPATIITASPCTRYNFTSTATYNNSNNSKYHITHHEKQ